MTIPNSKEQHPPHIEALKPGLLRCSAYFCSAPGRLGFTAELNVDSRTKDISLLASADRPPSCGCNGWPLFIVRDSILRERRSYER
jgi:hypothetical protein